MSRHYSSSDFVTWLRLKVFKVDKPYALGWGEWAKWEAKLKAERRIAHFFTETLPDWVQWIPDHTVDYVNDFRYYITNRMHGSHRLNSTLKKGDYHEFGSRMLYSMFDTYVEFIEIEEAYSHIAWSKDEDRKKYNAPWWRRYWFLRWGQQWRSPDAAVDHLKWEMGLADSPGQAESAREKMALYTWWKHIRPSRGDDWEVSGFRAHWDEMEEKYGDDWLGLGSAGKMSRSEKATYDKLSDAKDALEAQWAEEDTQMMIRLVKIRENLWT